MRPGQNKRMRGRNNNNNNSNRRGPHPLTRSYESNGPDVKIRGTAHHVGEKYLQLARDAQSSGDPVMAESYLQHAEHYFRLIASAQLAQQQAQFGYQRQPGEALEQDDDNDDDFESLPDRFASPSERAVQAQPPSPPPMQQGHTPQGQASQGQPQPYEARGDRTQNDRSNGDRSYNDRGTYDGRNGHDNRGNASAGNGSSNDRGGHEGRQRYADRQDRNHNGGERNTYQDRGGASDRGGVEANGQEPRGSNGERGNFGGDRNNGVGRDERQTRDYDNRNFRNRRDERPRDASIQPRLPVPEEQPVVGLPAFITAPTRVPVADISEPSQPVVQTAVVDTEAGSAIGAGDDVFPARPRRRRRPKPDFAEAGSGNESVSPTPGSDAAD